MRRRLNSTQGAADSPRAGSWFHDRSAAGGGCGTVQIGAAPSRLGVRPGQRRAADARHHLDVEDLLHAGHELEVGRPAGPCVRSTTPTPHFSSGRRSAIGMPPNVEVSRIFDRPTNAKRSYRARPRV